MSILIRMNWISKRQPARRRGSLGEMKIRLNSERGAMGEEGGRVSVKMFLPGLTSSAGCEFNGVIILLKPTYPTNSLELGT